MANDKNNSQQMHEQRGLTDKQIQKVISPIKPHKEKDNG